MRFEVNTIQEQLRDELHKQQQDRLGVEDVQYAIGDYVWVAAPDIKKLKKLSLRWTGPYQVVEVLSPWVYKVKSVVSDVIFNVHVCRLRLYDSVDMIYTVDMKSQFLFDTYKWNIEMIVNHRFNNETKDFELEIVWENSSVDASTWESFESVVMSFSEEVKRYLDMFTEPVSDEVKRMRVRFERLQSK